MPKKAKTTLRPGAGKLPDGINRAALYKLWASARRRDASAQAQLHRLLQAHPEVEPTLRAFAAERDARIREDAAARSLPAKKPQVLGAWERNARKAGRWVGIVSGGLPTLGKRRQPRRRFPAGAGAVARAPGRHGPRAQGPFENAQLNL